MKHNIVIVFILYFLLTGCTDPLLFNKPVQQAIVKKVQGCALDTNSNCLLNLKDVTDFNWDKMYIFSEYADYDSIGKVIGFIYHNNNGFIPDETTRLIFTSKNSVVHEEDMDWHSSNGSLVDIDLPDDTSSFSKEKDAYTKKLPYVERDCAIYLARRTNHKNGRYAYYLVLKSNLGKKAFL